jgi:hypothetical protein
MAKHSKYLDYIQSDFRFTISCIQEFKSQGLERRLSFPSVFLPKHAGNFGHDKNGDQGSNHHSQYVTPQNAQ